MHYLTNVQNTVPAVHDPGAPYDPGDRYTESGTRVPAAEVRAREVADQAHRWLAFAVDRSRMRPGTLTAKALAAVAFSVHHGAASLAVPSKLAGTSGHQRALWALVRDRPAPWAELALDATGGPLVASLGGAPLGAVQAKHAPWVRPLLPFGLTVHIARVTGHAYEAYTLGCNVCFGHVGLALGRLLDALGGGPGGDGAPIGPVPVVSASSGPGVPDAGGAATPVRLLVHPEHDTLRPGADPDDDVLYRRLDGTACATVPHAARHSPTGPEWGYGGSGPADLARSVLLALTDDDTAERLYRAFAADVVARVPHPGGVLRAADVRAWAAAHDDVPPAA